MHSNILRLAIVAALASCLTACAGSAKAPAAAAPAARPESGALIPLTSRSTPDGEVTAVWMGIDPGSGVGPDSPVGIWIREIHFYFGAEPTPFRYPAAFEPDSATFEIFSPDGAYVALSQGSGATFHLVAVASLRAYLQDKQTPHEEVIGARGPNDAVPYAHQPRWATDRIFEFEAVSGQLHWHVTHLVGGPTEVGPTQHVQED